ncbi:DUF6624 domain-containing protein [Streptomyces sp. NPDC002602]|uniref:DUF6624 domain-containing protein n=1 Tax=Streptomyces sp. NPDC002602 TaxID=3364654 RepID=UPI0036944677
MTRNPGSTADVHLILRASPNEHFREGDSILLGVRKGTGWCDGKYQVPSGHVEDEPAIDAVIREAEEETGVILTRDQVRFVHMMHRRSDGSSRVDFFFEAIRWGGTITNTEPDKCGGWEWHPMDKIPTDTIPYLAHAIGLIREGVAYSEWGWKPHSELTAELLRRMDEDQEVRRIPAGEWTHEATERLMAVDASNREALRHIIAGHGWPGISLVGKEGARAAWLIAQHADADPVFQGRARDLLASAVEAGDAEPQHLAYLTDRCLVGAGEPQLYGTQYGADGPRPVADPDQLDERRAAVSLGPHAEYDAQMRASRDNG